MILGMPRVSTKVTLTEPGLAGDYVLEERLADGSLVLRPDTSAAAMERRAGLRAMSTGEFAMVFGGLSRDGEG